VLSKAQTTAVAVLRRGFATPRSALF